MTIFNIDSEIMFKKPDFMDKPVAWKQPLWTGVH